MQSIMSKQLVYYERLDMIYKLCIYLMVTFINEQSRMKAISMLRIEKKTFNILSYTLPKFPFYKRIMTRNICL